eukprot:TRINITY_DN686_c0_g1_i1.p1 TRINITY_DN686_c0_g1~~TRINITY_DN686_c0_g1_i1.p1  ORF type:complete len:345 (-),score=132.13 TRINITY_DN686_c0_g1_i1:153-1148(-)
MSNGAIVAVTGASGYIAGSVIASLLERGYKVRGTVRALANADKTAHLRERFPGIELFEADLLKDGSFKACFEGADYVMHTASPFQLQVQDPQKDLIDPALHGTENVVSTALATPSVKRIVVTSSVAAVVGEERKEGVYTEEDWNMDSSLELNPYRYSKRLAEKRAWALVEEQQRPEGAPRVTLTCINPSFVLGPPHSERSDSTSVAIVKAILNGSMKENGGPPLRLPSVDVREIATAHVNAMERDEAQGMRFIVSSEDYYTVLDYAEMLRKSTKPEIQAIASHLPTKLSAEPAPPAKISAARAEAVLGVRVRPVAESIEDMALFLIQHGMV